MCVRKEDAPEEYLEAIRRVVHNNPLQGLGITLSKLTNV